MTEKIVITSIENESTFYRLLENNPGIIIIKLGATWCKPCRDIKPVLDGFFGTSPNTVVCCDIDVDQCFHFYSFLKRVRMVNGIPALLLYKKGNTKYIPDDSLTGADPIELDKFFKRCALHLKAVNLTGKRLHSGNV
jgi:thiol-disulfide isomerase/thioredoxin